MADQNDTWDVKDLLKDNPNNLLALANLGALAMQEEDGPNLLQILLEFKSQDGRIVEDNVIIQVINWMRVAQINNLTKGNKTALYSAVVTDREEIVRKLLEKGADKAVYTVSGRQVIHWACARKNISIVGLLLAADTAPAADTALTKCQDGEGLLPLHISCQNGWDEGVKLLLSKDKSVLGKGDKYRRTPLHLAVEGGYERIVSMLLENEDNGIEQCNKKGETPLHRTSVKGYDKVAKVLISKGAKIEVKDQKGHTPLHNACYYGHDEMVKMLVKNGADVLAQTTTKETPLMTAIKRGHINASVLLLNSVVEKKGIDQIDADGRTALYLACERGNEKIAEALLQHGADRTKQANNEFNALECASRNGHTETVTIFLRETKPEATDINATYERRFTALHHACQMGHTKTATLLLDKGADCKITNSDGKNSLHVASEQGCLEIVQLLLKNNRNLVHHKGVNGWTALHLASSRMVEDVIQLGKHANRAKDESSKSSLGRFPEVIDVLLAYGADLKAKTEQHSTALHIAVEKNHPNRVSHLLKRMKDQEFMSMTDSTGLTALGIAMENKNLNMVNLLLKETRTAYYGDVLEKEDLMLWLAKERETHCLLKLLLSKEASSETPPSASQAWEAMEWAAFRKYPMLLWWLLFTGIPSPERDRRIRRTIKFIQSPTREAEGPYAYNECNATSDLSLSDVSNDTESERFWAPPESQFSHDSILEILRSPPMTKTKTSEQKQEQAASLEKPIYSQLSIFEKNMTEIVDLYEFESDSALLQASHRVKDAVYGNKLNQLMKDRRENANAIGERYGKGSNFIKLGWKEDDLKVRWINLPANNMKWMKDLALTLNVDRDCLRWFSNSWDEIEGPSPDSCFMKPKFVSRDKAPSSENKCTTSELKEDGPMAIYMPYFSLDNHVPERQQENEDTRLLHDYTETPIHASQTLDDFYYRQKTDADGRNEDQVATRIIRQSEGNKESQVLINVNQMWIWVVDSKTIVTSSTYRRDGTADPVLAAVLEQLSQPDNESAAKKRMMDAFELAQIIMGCCIHLFHKKLRIEVKREVKKKDSSTGAWKGSIQTIFTDAISQASLDEARLFKEFINKKKRGSEEEIQERSEVGKDRILNAANLLRHAKDIRDELKAIKAVVEYQKEAEEEQLSYKNSDGVLPASSLIITEIDEMDKMAERIENAVNTTLILEQNDEAIQQNNIMMAFTGATIIFLPISFFTSFFALDVSNFLKTPYWAFLVIFLVLMVTSVPFALYAWKHGYVKKLRPKYIIRQSIPNLKMTLARSQEHNELIGETTATRKIVPAISTRDSMESFRRPRHLRSRRAWHLHDEEVGL